MTPARVGPYRLVEPVSGDALTITYRAEHLELERKVLIKMLKPTVPPSSPFAQELEREAKILARMQHEAVVELYDFVREGGVLYLVLEDPQGFPLSDVLGKLPRLPPDVAAAIAIELSRGLGHAHERGVVHREVRPDHVQLTREGRVKITSFAAAHDARAASIPVPFEGSATFGRPDYMAPEQILGDDAGARSDVFAIGVVLYEMIAGSRPFSGPARPSAPGAASLPGAARERAPEDRETAHRIRNEPPPPLRDAVPDVPRAIEQVILRCLAKRPDDRFDDARAVAAALEAALAARSHLPIRVLASRALSAAKLAVELPAPAAIAAKPAAGAAPLAVLPAARAMAALFALIVAGGAGIELLREDDGPRRPDASGVAARWGGGAVKPGYIRVLARPWAEVLLDGELVDVTPIGRPIPVSPGRHYLTFRHPQAPDEKRDLKIASGQTIVVDVTMLLDRPAKVDAGAASPDAAVDP
jgi:eukaryotic-like serine/threonine-protein kinase